MTGKVQETAMRTHHGFTLVEVMIVLAIIGVLVAFLMPVLAGAGRDAQQAELTGQFENLRTALETFKSEFNCYPPSSFTLRENGGAYTAAEQGILRRLWPRMNLAHTWDFDDDGVTTGTFPLNGAQCLVFFLGGPPDPQTHVGMGFDPDPETPFAPQLSVAGGRQRLRFRDFKPEELIQLASSQQANAGSRGLFYAVADPLDTELPIAYFCDFPGVGYTAAHNSFATPYRKDAGGTAVYWNAKGYQLISAGIDGRFGSGGRFLPNQPRVLDEDDRDNRTNFHNTVLGDVTAE